MSESSSKSLGSSASSTDKKKTEMRFKDEEKNPCLMEADISRKCLDRNNYIREKCSVEYLNYNQCKKFWGQIRKQRKLAGIKPFMPSKEEREKILELKKNGKVVTSVS